MIIETVKIAGFIQIEEKVVFLHRVAQKRGVSSTGEAMKTGEKSRLT